ncbi:MAG: hypothetical protein JO107_15610 [Hyphomicrobiales bacterium]|nr:hypothetical protein [Hyphomicrobiales bacterium]MBV8664516.1 hypothetical protein [Hyphomicrobiales bacterium]
MDDFDGPGDLGAHFSGQEGSYSTGYAGNSAAGYGGAVYGGYPGYSSYPGYYRGRRCSPAFAAQNPGLCR